MLCVPHLNALCMLCVAFASTVFASAGEFLRFGETIAYVFCSLSLEIKLRKSCVRFKNLSLRLWSAEKVGAVVRLALNHTTAAPP